MDKQDIRYMIAFALGIIGFMVALGSVGGLEYGDLTYGQAIAQGVVGLLIMAAAVPASGDLPDIMQELSDKRKNRR